MSETPRVPTAPRKVKRAPQISVEACCAAQVGTSCLKAGEGILLIVQIDLDSSGLWYREENQTFIKCWCLLAFKSHVES